MEKPQLSLFEEFDGLEGYEAVEYYQHEANWSNRMILGDSLQVMASLAEKENLRGKVQMIYLDPPYGIKFGSNWQARTDRRDVRDAKAEDVTREVEQIKAFRDTWEFGVNSYLAYLRDRITVARDLLTESGSIFVQIGDDNVHLVRALLDEVFGTDNMCGQISFAKTSGQTDNLLASVSDYLLWYARNRKEVKYHQLYTRKELRGVGGGEYTHVMLSDGSRRGITEEESLDLGKLPSGARLFRFDNLTSQSPGTRYEVRAQREDLLPERLLEDPGQLDA